MSARLRIIKGMTAHVTTLATRIAVQFATLPIFFACWDADRVGAWFVVFAIPAYVALVGNGFSGAGGTSSLAAIQAGDARAARAYFRVSWMIASLATVALSLVFLAGAATFGAHLPVPPEVGRYELFAAAAWLALYILATSQMGVAEIPFRACGRYPEHIALYNVASLVEIAVIALAVTQSESLATLAAALALTRCVAAAVVFLAARRIAPALFEKGHTALGASAARLWKPSLTLMLVPLIFGLNLQGYVLVIGAGVGAAVLASFLATRSLTRLLDLLTNLAYAAQFYEAGYIDGPKRAIQRRLLATMTLASLAVSLGFAAALMLGGPWLQDLYTLGQTSFDRSAAAILLAAGTLRALAAAPIAMLTAENRHAPIVLTYLTGSAAALALAAALATTDAPLAIVLAPLLLAEACQLVPAMRAALAKVGLPLPQFLGMLASRDRGADIVGAFSQLRRKS